MDLREFQKETEKTCANLGSSILNSLHMSVGMASESMSELPEAIKKDDVVNIMEELMDIQYYAVNYCRIHDINILENLDFTIKQLTLFPEKDVIDVHKLINNMNNYIGQLLDADKAEWVYDKRKNVDRATLINNVIVSTELIARCYNIDTSDGRQKLINKLRIRYGNQFSKEAASNRNLEAERAALEN